MNTIRQEKIRELIERNRVVTTKELQALCPEVSFMTIHRDLDALEQQGICGLISYTQKQEDKPPVFYQSIQLFSLLISISTVCSISCPSASTTSCPQR